MLALPRFAVPLTCLAFACGSFGSPGEGPQGPSPGSSSPDGAACGASGPVGSFSIFKSPTQDDFQSISGTGRTDIWASALTSLWHWDGSTWTSALSGMVALAGSAVWAAAANDVWYSNGGVKSVLHGDGRKWTSVLLHDNRTVLYFWGNSTHDLWGAEGLPPMFPGYLGHWDGSTWTHIDSIHGGPLWGSGMNAVWNAGYQKVARVTDGSPDFAFAGTMYAIWGSATDDIWAVGSGQPIHYDGHAWSTASPLPTSATMRGLWGSCSDDVWAVGDGGTTLHFDGRSWSIIASPTTASLRSIWGSQPTEAWAVGDGGTILHFAR